MKLLLMLIVLAVAVLMFAPRRRTTPPRGSRTARSPQREAMVACLHCGLHLPRSEATADTAGRPFCSDAHRLAGPRESA